MDTTNDKAAPRNGTASRTPHGHYNPEIVRLEKPMSAATIAALRVEVAGIVKTLPSLGRDGFAVAYVTPAIERGYLSTELFAVEVAKGLQQLATLPMNSRSYFHTLGGCVAAAVVAYIIAGYKVHRIPGHQLFRISGGSK